MSIIANRELSDWYVIQTLSGKEEDVKNGLLKYVLKNDEIIYPKRKILVRKAKTYIDSYQSLFPGYIFYKGQYYENIYSYQNRLRGFIKVITEKKNPVPLYKSEIERILSLINDSNTIDYSEMIVEGDKVKVISGPLMDLEGIIKKINIRKQRVTISLYLFGREQEVVLSFSMIDKIT